MLGKLSIYRGCNKTERSFVQTAFVHRTCANVLSTASLRTNWSCTLNWGPIFPQLASPAAYFKARARDALPHHRAWIMSFTWRCRTTYNCRAYSYWFRLGGTFDNRSLDRKRERTVELCVRHNIAIIVSRLDQVTRRPGVKTLKLDSFCYYTARSSKLQVFPFRFWPFSGNGCWYTETAMVLLNWWKIIVGNFDGRRRRDVFTCIKPNFRFPGKIRK